MAETKRPRGLYFEELTVGIATESDTRTITAEDISLFAGLSGDDNPLHIDPEYAKTTVFGRQVAHGLLGLAVASGLAWQTGLIEGTTEALIGLDWKFRTPVYIGDTVRVQAEIKKKRDTPRLGGGLVTFSVAVLNQRDEIVQKGSWTALIRSKPTGEG